MTLRRGFGLVALALAALLLFNWIRPGAAYNALANVAVGVADPTSGNQANVAAFHSADNQQPGGSAFGILTGGVAQLLNVAGNLDRQREAGIDNAPSRGVATGAQQLAMAFATTSSTTTLGGGAATTVTPAAMSLTVNGVTASIQVGSVLTVDTGAAQESVWVTATAPTTFTANFANAHSGTYAITGFAYNNARDAAGELDLANGAGTAIAAGYALDGRNFVRERTVAGHGLTKTTSSTSLASAGTNLVITTVATLPTYVLGEAILVDAGTANAEWCQVSAISGTSVTLRSTVNIHTTTPYQVYAPTQSFGRVVQSAGLGLTAEADVVFSGNDTNGVALHSQEQDVNAIGVTSAATPTQGTAGSAGITGEAEYGIALTAAQTYLANQMVPAGYGQGGDMLVTVGGRLNLASTAALQVVKSTPGRLCRVIVTATGTSALNLFDNASAASGTIIGAIPSTATVGQVFDFQTPAANGIVSNNSATTPAVTITYY